MPYILARYRERHPLADPRLDISDSSRVLERVRAGEVDLGCVGFREEDDRLRYGLLCEDRLVFIAPPDHPLSRRRSLKPTDLEGEPLLYREEGSGTRSHMLKILAGLGLEKGPGDAMVLGSTMAVIQAVVAGEGISVVSLWAASAYIKQGLVSALKTQSAGAQARVPLRAAAAASPLHRHRRPAGRAGGGTAGARAQAGVSLRISHAAGQSLLPGM